MPGERPAGAGFGLLLWVLGGANLGLSLLLNELTLSFLYADGRLVPDVVARIRTVQAGFASMGLLFGVAGAALRARPPRFPRRFWDRALAVLLLVYVPVVAELLLSLGYPGFYRVWDPFGLCRTGVAIPDAQLGHVLNPNLDHSYRINSHGFRGPGFPGPKPAGEVRVVTVGDSITFGWELSEEESTYPGKLQALLDRLGSGRIRVVNAGIPRYTSEQALRLLQHRVLDLQPDLVVLCVGWNDLAFSYHRDWRPRISFTGTPRARHCRSFSPAIVRTIRHWKGDDDEEADDEGVEQNAEKKPARRKRTPHPGAVAEFRANLDEIAALLRSRGVGLLLLNLPSVLSHGPMSPVERSLARRFPEVENQALFGDVIRDFCRASQTACALDVFPLEEADKGRYFYDHCHPNADGNGIVARKVYEALERDPRLRALLGAASR